MPMFALNNKVAAEVFDDECIIANLDSGLYYSVQGNGINLINALPFNDPEPVIEQLVSTLQEHASECAEQLTAIWAELLSEGIVAEQETPAPQPASPAPIQQYSQPVLNRYADMQDLLLLDPIHDVSEDGW